MLLERAACFRALPNPGRRCSALPLPPVRFSSSAQTNRESQLFGKRATLAAGLTAVVGACVYIAIPRVHAGGASGVHPATFPWDNKPWNKIFDRASVRRGFQVFKEVCSQCHSLKYVAFRDLIDVTHTEAEVKAIAAEYEVEDGPDDNGDMFMRPAIPNDKWPKPYKNDQAARVANAGALPPDLSLITKARPYGADYVFSLLTGYCDPPPGAEVKDGLHFNPYFPGGWIAMARNLYDGVVEYEDGTPATTSQLAKDVTTFLWWASEPDHDMRKELGPKAFAILIPLTILSWYLKRFKFAAFKSRKIVFNPPKR